MLITCSSFNAMATILTIILCLAKLSERLYFIKLEPTFELKHTINDCLFLTLMLNIGNMTALIPASIVHCRSNDRPSLTRSSANINYRLSRLGKGKYRVIITYIMISLMDSFLNFCNFMKIIYSFAQQAQQADQNDNEKSTTKKLNLTSYFSSFQVIAACIACKCLLKTKFERHKLCGICLLIFSTLLTILTMIFSDRENAFPENPFEYFMCFGSLYMYIWSPIQECIEKQLMENDFQSPYMILLYEGTIGVVGCAIAIVVVRFGFKIVPEQPLTNNEILLLIAFCPIACFYSYTRIILNWKFNPFARLVGDKFTIMIFFVYNIILSWCRGKLPMNNQIIFIVHVISNVIIFIGVLIHNEILILHCCKLDIDTKKQIDIREIDEGPGLIEDYESFNKSKTY